MTQGEITGLLDEMGLKYRVHDPASVVLTFRTDRYVNPDGDKSLLLVIQLEEDGEYFKLFAPKAMRAGGEHLDTFLKACLMVQWETKFVQFELDTTDGEVRPMVEFALEDAVLTRRQLERCIMSLCRILEEFHEPLTRALREGVIELPRPGTAEEPPPPEVMTELLILSLKARGAKDDDPQVVQLRRMLEEMKARKEDGGQPPDSI